MLGRKSFTTPIWWMSIMILFQILSTLAFYMAMQRDSSGDIDVRGFYIERTVFLFLLIAELIFYSLYRKSIQVKSMAVWHIVCLVIGFIVLPLIQVLLPVWYSFRGSIEEYSATFEVWAYGLRLVFWSLLVLGHIFFGLLLMKGLYRKEKVPAVLSEDDILNEYAD